MVDSTKYIPVEENNVVTENDFLVHSGIKVENAGQSEIVFGHSGGGNTVAQARLITILLKERQLLYLLQLYN